MSSIIVSIVRSNSFVSDICLQCVVIAENKAKKMAQRPINSASARRLDAMNTLKGRAPMAAMYSFSRGIMAIARLNSGV